MFDLVDRGEDAGAVLVRVASAGVFEDAGGCAGGGHQSLLLMMVRGSSVLPCAARVFRSTAEASSTRARSVGSRDCSWVRMAGYHGVELVDFGGEVVDDEVAGASVSSGNKGLRRDLRSGGC